MRGLDGRFYPLAPAFAFGEFFDHGEAANDAEREREVDAVFEFGGAPQLNEEMFVAEAGEAAALLGVFEVGGELAVGAGVRRLECGDERVVLDGETELPAAPDDST